MERTFRNAMLRLAGGDLMGGDTKGAELWLGLTEPPGGQPWRFESLSSGEWEKGEYEYWDVVIEWQGDNVHISHGDPAGGFSGVVKPDLTSEEDIFDGE